MNGLVANVDIYTVIDQYEEKRQVIPEMVEDIKRHCQNLENTCSTMGVFGGPVFTRGFDLKSEKELLMVLKKSSWRYLYELLNIQHIAPQTHLSKFEQLLECPPEFDEENIRGVFKDYVRDPRAMALQAFAEVFSSLDRFYKSHDNIKVGVKGLPKRVIIAGFGDWYGSHGAKRLADVINCLMRYRGRYDLCITDHMAGGIFRGNSAAHLFETHKKAAPAGVDTEPYKYQGLSLKAYQNGNCHVVFDKQALSDINHALAEYYGEVLPDAYEHAARREESTEVSKDLQFYPTPTSVAQYLVSDVGFYDGDEILEPSCGEGAIMQAAVESSQSMIGRPRIHLTGVEVHAGRAAKARELGFVVHCENFLEWRTERRFDKVLMNPPFYGKHYAKHIAAAYELLRPGGSIYAILPITARENHGIINATYENVRWTNLPVGSFRESGTNINTVIAAIRR